MSDSGKDGWDKAAIILRPMGGLLTALAVAWLGFQGRDVLESRQRAESKTQLYAQLMSAREQADSSLRQSMFNTIIEEFLVSPGDDKRSLPEGKSKALDDYEREVLKLEVLAYNFHDALDLAPLFQDVSRRLTDDDNPENRDVDKSLRDALVDRLVRVAREVTGEQVATLEESGAVRRVTIDLQEFDETGGLWPKAIDDVLWRRKTNSKSGELVGKAFSMDILDIDTAQNEVRVRLVVWAIDENGKEAEKLFDRDFSVGFFDFPMIDNTRLANGDRCAVVLDALTNLTADLTLVYFPGSRASLKQKPFYDEIIDKTLRLSDEDQG